MSGAVGGTLADDSLASAGQLRLTWLRFRRHKLAYVSLFIVVLFYLVAIFADFLAINDPHAVDARRGYLPPQAVHLFDANGFNPHVDGMTGRRDLKTFRQVYVPDPNKKLPVTLFARGYPYELFGLFETDRHLLGLVTPEPLDGIYLLGTDALGRDLFSRIMVATRISLSIGLASVTLSLILGILLGGVSGLYGGLVDLFLQRVIEVIRSIPTIPLWMGIAAALPNTWSVVRVYFAITVIISLIGWTELARLALPAMIISETSLSFLGLGLRPPAISWGILLQDAQNVQVLAGAPWLLLAAVPVVIVILAFNFLGDGLRDAADPYG